MHHTTAIILGCSCDVRVEYQIYPFMPGARDHGVPIEPDEPTRVEIDSVLVHTSVGWVAFDTDEGTDIRFADEILDQQ